MKLSLRNSGLTVPCVVSVAVHLVGILVLATRPSRAAAPNPPIAVEILAAPAPPEPAPEPPPPPRVMPSRTPIPVATLAPPLPTSKPSVEPAAPAPTVEPTAPAAEAGDVALPVAPIKPAAPTVMGRAPIIAAEPARGAGTLDIGAYTSALGRAIARHRRYPELAAQLGQEGTALVLVHVRRDGSLDGTPRIAESSGFDLLDKEALAMVGRAAPFAALPDGLPQPTAELRVPVRFHLED